MTPDKDYASIRDRKRDRIAPYIAELPVGSIAGEVNDALADNPCLVITAAPGAGKSTLLPLTILDSLSKGKIIMQEPRRIAAREIAERMARMLGENVGERVGYRIRFDSRVSDDTRIEVVTEGVLERMLTDDPFLEGVAVVIFDEFHERSLAGDMTLALTREVQAQVRPDLRIVVMSATIDAENLCRSLNAKHIHSEGKMYPVEIVYSEDFDLRECAAVVASAVRKAHRENEGDILAFLPGQADIIRCAEILHDSAGDSWAKTTIEPLYGMLTTEMQHRAILPSPQGMRKIVLSTPIAETSLTIEGITVVVDSGLCRILRFNPSTGLSRLETVRVSADMAAQRAGRAGRIREGVCYRLWSKATEHRMAHTRIPEILDADLASAILTICAWGETDPMRLPWITPPPSGNIAEARKLLLNLGALNEKGEISTLGKRMASLPCHPRIAAMLLRAETPRLKALAADIAAIIEEKDILNNDDDADINTRIAMLRQQRLKRKAGRWQRVASIAGQYRRMIHIPEDNSIPESADAGRLIAAAYPARVAQRMDDGRYRLAGGGFVSLSEADDLARSEYLAAAAVDRRVFLAAPVRAEDLKEMAFKRENVTWDSRQGRAVARTELRLGALILDTKPLEGDRHDLIIRAICEAAPKEGLTMFDFNDDVLRLQRRIATLAEWHPELNVPDLSTDALLARAAEWLPLYAPKASTVAELRKTDMRQVILALLGYDLQNALERIAPSHLQLPCGRRARIDYRAGAEAPIVSARLQDCFGLIDTPRLDEGRRPVLMELLSPGFKPVQLTRDLRNFWSNTYFEVRKELKRRYPKHRWPDDPLQP